MNPHLALPLRYSGAPLGGDAPVVVAVHGRGQGPAVIEEVGRLDWPRATCVAPAAADGSWYPAGFMAPTELNEPSLSYALEAYDRWIGTLSP